MEEDKNITGTPVSIEELWSMEEYKFNLLEVEEQRYNEVFRRITNSLMGLKFDKQGNKVLKIILNQLFIDGFLLTDIPSNKLLLSGFVHDIKINCTISNRD